MKKIQKYLREMKAYIAERSELFVGIGVVAVLVLVVGVIALVMQLSGPRIVYQPVKACDLLTPAKAQDLLGDKVISTDANKPAIDGNVATSKCAYTDENPDQDQMRLAAVAIRSAINDEGDVQNREEFAQAKKANGEDNKVTGVGESAFFNASKGQLNVLTGHMWLIINYGYASSVETNAKDQAIELIHAILPATKQQST